MPPRTGTGERIARAAPEKFKSPEEELAYLRARIAEKERELENPSNQFERDRIARREVQEYAATPAPQILHETVVMAEHDTVRHALKLEPEEHDAQMDGLLQLVAERGIRNALSVVARMKNPHLEDDLHRMLVRYIAEGLPQKGLAPPERVVRALHLVLFEIHPQSHGESEDKQAQQKLEQVLASSEQLYAGFLSLIGADEGFSLEIAVAEGTVEAAIYVAVPREKKQLAERLISSVFPNTRVSECRGDYNIFNYQGAHAAAYATLKEHPAYPLKTFEMFEHDPMNILLAAFAKIAKHGEGAALQIVVGNEGERYNHHYKKIIRSLEKGKPIGKALQTPETVVGEVIHDTLELLLTSEKQREEEKSRTFKQNDQVATEEITRKIKSRIAPTIIRLVASGPDASRAETLLSNLITPFAQYEDAKGNSLHFQRVSSWSSADFLRQFTYRTFDASYAIPLSLSEIATIVHFTAERVQTSRELKQSRVKQAPAPVNMPHDGITLGINRYGAEETPVRFGANDRLRHCYVIGQTGTGKTGILKNMIIQDMQNGEGVAYVDPHGTDIEDILAAVPPERYEDVIYFDPAYAPRPMGLNMLEYDVARPELKTFVVDEVYNIFRKLYNDIPEAFGPMFEQYYRNAAQLVVEDQESGSTLLEIPRVMADHEFRRLKLSRCKNPVIVNFWTKIAEAAGGEASLENIVPYISSKIDVFTANDIMRPIVAQQHSAFDFREIMDSKKIFLANLSKGRLGERNASLLGLVLVSKFLQAAFSRVDTQGSLPTFYLYIDEFQNFATSSISTILSEARKYKLSLTIAHQFIAQLDEKIRDAVIGNVGTKVAFRIGTTDAEFLEKQFNPVFTRHDLENQENRNAAVALLVDGVPARPFTLRTADLPTFNYAHVDSLKELSYRTYGRDREEVEEEVRERYATKANANPLPDYGVPTY
ncbi:MAG TPA: TraM recognition domain-containing protein [Candidatus Paceibacterota bacterium]|nr:TraM recognition domain-containing protein [Candidatus Paceibacterota bacterium]